MFAGDASSYPLATANGVLSVVDNAPGTDGDDGTDVIASIETLRFKNGQSVSVPSPIILDLDGDGLADETSWIGGIEALLLIDRNRDGAIKDMAELSLAAEQPDAASGLAGLSWLDTEADGSVDARDVRFGELRVWADAAPVTRAALPVISLELAITDRSRIGPLQPS